MAAKAKTKGTTSTPAPADTGTTATPAVETKPEPTPPAKKRAPRRKKAHPVPEPTLELRIWLTVVEAMSLLGVTDRIVFDEMVENERFTTSAQAGEPEFLRSDLEAYLARFAREKAEAEDVAKKAADEAAKKKAEEEAKKPDPTPDPTPSAPPTPAVVKITEEARESTCHCNCGGGGCCARAKAVATATATVGDINITLPSTPSAPVVEATPAPTQMRWWWLIPLVILATLFGLWLIKSLLAGEVTKETARVAPPAVKVEGKTPDAGDEAATKKELAETSKLVGEASEKSEAALLMAKSAASGAQEAEVKAESALQSAQEALQTAKAVDGRLGQLASDLSVVGETVSEVDRRADQLHQAIDENFRLDDEVKNRVIELERRPPPQGPEPKIGSTPLVVVLPTPTVVAAPANTTGWTDQERAISARMISRCRMGERYDALGLGDLVAREQKWLAEEERLWAATSKKPLPTREELDRAFPVWK